MVDIFPSISGVDFEGAWQRRVDVAIDDELTAPFISRQDLLAAKISAGRPQDLADVAALHEAEKHREDAQQQSLPPAPRLMKRRSEGQEEWLKKGGGEGF